ncbi:protein WEAK CHLOROPLAST MOVEMENT UNDER BLUE LIGHT 1 isoform X1 [Zea mays]|uniref:Protein WEAK CHLOROPLAST MOVEMENT UNDER BLUE LIGHT 1 n=1 Tax=Zea mays TaxID=4577 RepID=A0A1D6JKU2_MAIZE|nr:Protein WEAK CHLOROPLAST MOVEMENT UNDER BLUE LIGHT 1 [Zea mays]XP_020394697.1 uncharacterized protein LOC100501456 isoform X1 [Zea mays]ONL92787.1 Protein WEAK CHLOROPLAST MOVEMENT UNDER BLUE LIGHT 1 [Zea mays]|eukprot:XP_008647098.1 uncharacterized protein LOC100501456 isoform X1 [Zea mays]
MEEANAPVTTSHPSSTAPDAPPDPAAVPSSSDQGSQSCQAQQQQVHQLDETREPAGSSYEASEIAGRFNEAIDPKAGIDAAAPIVDSVKGAVSKFGAVGVVDWREKRKHVQDELDKVREEVTEYQKRAQEAEAGRAQALRELGTVVTAADELGLGLEMARAEQAQARRQVELAELQLEEVRRGAKAELDTVRERRTAALADLRAARAEVESLEKVRARAAAEAGAAVAREREAAAASREAGKAVEDLTAELVALKGELESSHAAHVAAEQKRMGLAVAWEEDKARWQMELEEAEQEAKGLREKLVVACDVETKAVAASQLMASLKAELFAYAVERTTLGQEEEATAISDRLMLEKTKKELDDVKASVEMAKHEAKCLRVAAASMRDELEKEKAGLTALRRKERERQGLSSASIPYLEEELRWVTAELAEARAKRGSDESEMAERVAEARREAEEAKAKARSAREKVARAKEVAGVAKAAVAAMEARLEAVTREILAANKSAETATASAGALLQESKPSSDKDVEAGVTVTLTVQEYAELSRRAQETEEAAGMRVVEAVKLIKEAKDAEVRRLEKVARLDKQTEQRRLALEAATLEAEEAEFDKLSAERELRQWRAEHEQRRAPGDTDSPRPGLAEISVLHDQGTGEGRGNPHIVSPRAGYMPRTELVMTGSAADADADADARQRKTFFPRIVMFFARKRTQSWK